MSRSDKPDMRDWFGLRRVMDWSKARWLGRALAMVVALLFVMAVAVVGAVLAHALFGLPLDAPRIGFGNSQPVSANSAGSIRSKCRKRTEIRTGKATGSTK